LLNCLPTNDIVKSIRSSIRLFVDETTLYIRVDKPLETADILNSDIDTISLWAEKWLVSFNPSKTISCYFT